MAAPAMSDPLQRAAERLNRYRQRHPNAVRLARVASLAVRIEPVLLRTLRQGLLPDVDVGAEADLWFSPLVESRGAGAIVLESSMVSILRDDLAKDPALLSETRRITQAVHRHIALSLQLEETINSIALLGGAEATDAIDEALRPALRAIRAGGPSAHDLAQWALRAVPRFHSNALRCGNTYALWLAASAVLGVRRPIPTGASLGPSLASFGWALARDALATRVAVDIEFTDVGVRFIEPTAGRPPIDVPNTEPLLVELDWVRNDTRFRQLTQVEIGRAVDLGGETTDLTLRTLTGDEYHARATPWTEAVVDDAAHPGFIRRQTLRLAQLSDALVWSPDGRALAIMLDGHTVSRLKPFSPTGAMDEFLWRNTYGETIVDIAWGGSGEGLLAFATTENVKIIDANSAQSIALMPYESAVSHVAWSPDGALLAAAYEGVVDVWSVQRGASSNRLATFYLEEAEVRGLAFSSSGQLAAAGARRVTVWSDRDRGVTKRHAPEIQDELSSLTWHPQSSHLALGTKHGDVMTWQLSDDAERYEDDAVPGVVRSLAFSSDGRVLLAADDSGSIALLNPPSQVRASMAAPAGRSARVAVSPDARSVAVCRSDGTLTVWEVDVDTVARVAAGARRKCLVVMGSGVKEDESNRRFDLDAVYRTTLKPAVEAAGFECRRAEEIEAGGAVFNELLTAELVIADLTASAPSVYYELGIRHALRQFSTIVVAEDTQQVALSAFDKTILRYSQRDPKADGDDEVRRLQSEITKRILQTGDAARAGSPLYASLPQLRPPSMATTEASTRQSDTRTEDSTKNKECFVIMGFGLKVDSETGRTFDLDKTYDLVIKPAVEASGLTCLRNEDIDPINVAGFYEKLFSADLAIADLSASVRPVWYELGMRHALRPRGTIVMMGRDGSLGGLNPDPGTFRFFQYRPLGADIDGDAALARHDLQARIEATLREDRTDSPVYARIDGLQPAFLGSTEQHAGTASGSSSDFIAALSLQPGVESMFVATSDGSLVSIRGVSVTAQFTAFVSAGGDMIREAWSANRARQPTSPIWRPEEIAYFQDLLLTDSRIRDLFFNAASMQLSLDRDTAKCPWELFTAGSTKDRTAVGLGAVMVRQEHQDLGPPHPRSPPAAATDVSALVLCEQKGMTREVEAIRSLLARSRIRTRVQIGSARSALREALRTDAYDIIHLVEMASSADQSGITVELTVAPARKPSLLFFSADLGGSAPNTAMGLLRGGVRSVIVADHPFEQGIAQVFAERLYGTMIAGESFGRAVLEARRTVQEYSPWAWAALQAYGDPATRFAAGPIAPVLDA
jgi:hypothetical protein